MRRLFREIIRWSRFITKLIFRAESEILSRRLRGTDNIPGLLPNYVTSTILGLFQMVAVKKSHPQTNPFRSQKKKNGVISFKPFHHPISRLLSVLGSLNPM